MKKYRNDAEYLLSTMLNCIREGEIPRYILRTKIGPRFKAKQLDELLQEVGVQSHVKDDVWKGLYYKPDEVADALYHLRERLNREEAAHIRQTIRERAY